MKAVFVIGTRPEAIKMAPVIGAFARSEGTQPVVLVTGQHREMLQQVLDFFGIKPDHDLALMSENQSLCGLTARAITGIEQILDREQAGLLLVQGDTTSAFAGAYAGFLKRVPVAHVEAGLRTWNPKEPFPEEINRQLIGNLASLHLCPTAQARENLVREGKREGLHVVGNTVIDALLQGLAILGDSWRPEVRAVERMANPAGSVLVTIHRRESFGAGVGGILRAIRTLANRHPAVSFVFPVHPNPNIRRPVHEALAGVRNIHLCEPLDYAHFIWAMSKARVILTDSGGVQEEAPTLGVPVLVARNVTERQEGVEAGVAILVGTDEHRICEETAKAIASASRHTLPNPYGDGNSSARILEACQSLDFKKA